MAARSCGSASSKPTCTGTGLLGGLQKPLLRIWELVKNGCLRERHGLLTEESDSLLHGLWPFASSRSIACLQANEGMVAPSKRDIFWGLLTGSVYMRPPADLVGCRFFQLLPCLHTDKITAQLREFLQRKLQKSWLHAPCLDFGIFRVGFWCFKVF